MHETDLNIILMLKNDANILIFIVKSKF
jgi:hypothetical protein